MRAEANKAFQQLNQNQQALAGVVAQNQDVLRKAFTFTDAHLFVQRRIMQDMFRNRARPTPLHEEDVEWLATNPGWEAEAKHLWMMTETSEIDFGWYYDQYNGATGFFGFIEAWAKARNAEQEEEKKDDETPDEKGTVFGGDYEDSNTSSDEETEVGARGGEDGSSSRPPTDAVPGMRADVRAG